MQIFCFLDQGGVYSVSNLLQHLKINNKNGDKLKSLQDENLNLFPSNDDSNELKDVEEYLQDIGDEQDFTITYVDVEKNRNRTTSRLS